MLLEIEKSEFIARVAIMYLGRELKVSEISRKLQITQMELWHIIHENITYLTETEETERLVLQSKINL